MGKPLNKTMMIIHHSHEFLELPDGSKMWKFVNRVDFRGERANS